MPLPPPASCCFLLLPPAAFCCLLLPAAACCCVLLHSAASCCCLLLPTASYCLVLKNSTPVAIFRQGRKTGYKSRLIWPSPRNHLQLSAKTYNFHPRENTTKPKRKEPKSTEASENTYILDCGLANDQLHLGSACRKNIRKNDKNV